MRNHWQTDSHSCVRRKSYGQCVKSHCRLNRGKIYMMWCEVIVRLRRDSCVWIDIGQRENNRHWQVIWYSLYVVSHTHMLTYVCVKSVRIRCCSVSPVKVAQPANSVSPLPLADHTGPRSASRVGSLTLLHYSLALPDVPLDKTNVPIIMSTFEASLISTKTVPTF